MSIPLIPESAPFSAEQRAWLNGFLAGVLGLSGQANAAGGTVPALANGSAGLGSSGTAVLEPADNRPDESLPWHDATLAIDERLKLAEGEPFPLVLMSAMAQLNCGACGYLCRTYSAAIAAGTEQDLTRCSPGGAETAKALKKLIKERPSEEVAAPASANTVMSNPGSVSAAGTSAITAAAPLGYSRTAPVVVKLKASNRLTHPDSPKDTRHVVLDLGETGLAYEAGDSLGICPLNGGAEVDQVLQRVTNPDQKVTWQGEQKSLRACLLEEWQLSRVPEGLFSALASCTDSAQERSTLMSLGEHDPDGIASTAGLLDVLERFPNCRPSAELLAAELKPLQPRLYSISSSQRQVGREVHLTVGVVQFESLGKQKFGVASHFLGVRSLPGDPIRVFVNASKFRLPVDSDLPVIMVGPGTGIAPFRAFLQDRAATGAKGPNWLLFGNQYSQYDYLYRDELEAWQRQGLLKHLTTAFSRETSQKIYVQDRMLEQGAELWEWLANGAYFYVCGDAKRMAKDVDQALRQIVSRHGRITDEAAKAFVQDLTKQRRYQKDVY